MKNIEKELIKAKENSKFWNLSVFKNVISNLKSRIDATFDWEEDVGEDWASFIDIDGDRRIAMVSCVIPVVVILDSLITKASDLAQQTQVISVPDFDTECLSCSLDILKKVFAEEFDEINPDKFSAEMLWWSTI